MVYSSVNLDKLNLDGSNFHLIIEVCLNKFTLLFFKKKLKTLFYPRKAYSIKDEHSIEIKIIMHFELFLCNRLLRFLKVTKGKVMTKIQREKD